MFRLEIQTGADSKAKRIMSISADSLYEAELLALKVVSKSLSNNNIMLVHVGDLRYEVYEIFDSIGSVQIKTL